MNNLIEFLKQEGVSAQLVEEVRHYSEEHTVDEALKKRIPVPHFHYYGNKVWEEALAVESHLLLSVSLSWLGFLKTR